MNFGFQRAQEKKPIFVQNQFIICIFYERQIVNMLNIVYRGSIFEAGS